MDSMATRFSWKGLLGLSLFFRMGLLAILVLLSFTTRLVPYSMSPLPFNNDGMTESRIATDILKDGDLEHPEGAFYTEMHSIITPAYNVLLAFVAAVLEESPFSVAQPSVAVFSVITIVSVFLIGLSLTANRRGALAGALTLCLLGTFVFVTASTWKESLGIALLALLVLAFMNRQKKQMLAAEVLILLLLPLVHHLVAFLAYLTIAYLTSWSVVFGLMNAGLRRRHVVDVIVIGITGLVGYIYYHVNSLDRLSYISSELGFFGLALTFSALFAAAVLALVRRSRLRISLAPIPAMLILGLSVWEYYNPLFPYEQGTPELILVLLIVMSVLISLAWYGLEITVESSSRFRAIPLGLLLPVVSLFVFALLFGFGLQSHQIIYRSFDFADLAMALGIAAAIGHLSKFRIRGVLAVSVLIAALLISLPFGYLTGPLTGVRHDTQEYEVDAITWVYDHAGPDANFQSDERLAYDARALYDYPKRASLPSNIVNQKVPGLSVYNMYEEEWTVVGVNDYPNGHPILNESYVLDLLNASNVLYVGGPEDNSAVIFRTSQPGMEVVLGY